MNSRAAGIVKPHHRRAHPHGVVHDLADLFRVRLAERAAEDGEVLAEHEHQSPVDRAASGNDAIARHALLGHAEVRGAVLDEHVVFLERAVVEQQLQTLAGSELALGMLPLDPRLAAAQPGAGAALFKRAQDVVHRLPSRRRLELPRRRLVLA